MSIPKSAGRHGWRHPLLLPVGAATILILASVAVVLALPVQQQAPVVAALPVPNDVRVTFDICGRAARINCVVDGDTLYIDGQKIRIADIDTPEIAQPACPREEELGLAATARLVELMNGGGIGVRRQGRDEDRYGRKLRILVSQGRSLGDTLVAEGLAHPWRGRKANWCD